MVCPRSCAGWMGPDPTTLFGNFYTPRCPLVDVSPYFGQADAFAASQVPVEL